MKNLMCVCATVAASCAFATMEPATPESQGVPSGAILKYIDACEKTFDGGTAGAIHGFVLVRHGKVIAEGSWRPFDTLNETHMLYSHSKSFTSSAVGFLVDAGKLDLDERVVDIFSNDCPATVSENLAQLRVRDLLTMNVGKKDHLVRGGGNWAKDFMGRDFLRKPGTGFKYDSDATYMLAAVVEKRAGMKMMDYLKQKMFDKIGIEKAWTTYSPQDIPCGGWGMNMTTRELARFGQLYLQKGAWNGEHLLSPYWVALATTRQTWSGWQNVGVKALGEGGDWEQGYGFQFWCCTHGAYRADGAAGQLTVVMPEQDAVISVHAGLGDMQKELSLIWDNLLPAMKDAPLPEDAAAQRALDDRLATLMISPVRAYGERSESALVPFVEHGRYELKDNKRGFKSLEILRSDDMEILCNLETRAGVQRFPVGFRQWRTGKVRIDKESYEGLGAYIGEHKTAAAYGVDREGALRIRVYLTGDPGYFDFAIAKEGKLTGEFWAMGGCKLESK